MAEELLVKVEYTGGLEMLFHNQKQHKITLPTKNSSGDPTTIADLIAVLTTDLTERHQKKDLFVLDGSVRPGILVLVNDADWELEGEETYEIQNKDNIVFVSTLHGG